MSLWHFSLSGSYSFWLDYVVCPPAFRDTYAGLEEKLEEIVDDTERNRNRKFIYFIASRPKIRFDATKRPRKKIGSRKYQIPMIFSGGQLNRSVNIDLTRYTSHTNPSVRLEEKAIHIEQQDGTVLPMSIYQFIDIGNYQIPAPSTIHYVGETIDPVRRLLKRKHRGLFDIVYENGSDSLDYFIYLNTIDVGRRYWAKANGRKVVTYDIDSDFQEIDYKKEGMLIECALIEYFGCSTQLGTRKIDQGKLRNSLKHVKKEHRVDNVSFHLEVDGNSDMYIFGSERQQYADSHTFLATLKEKNGYIKKLSSEDDLLAYLNSQENDTEQSDDRVQ